ncbi:MAG: hypothetical protein GY855_08955 [candidate division Zixibacteria bacterium]|nr:hypothetical protein [candidate division Zixibacteria bacterium]
MREEKKELYYKALESILEEDYSKANELLGNWVSENPDHSESEVFLILLSMRDECLRLMTENEQI